MAALISPFLLMSCIPPGWTDIASIPPLKRPPSPPPQPSPKGKNAVLPIPSSALKQCLADLDRMQVRYVRVADTSDKGCTVRNAVLVRGVGTVSVPDVTVTCPMAGRLSRWIAQDLGPLATSHLGSEVAGVGTMGSYVCRNVVGIVENRLSEHAFGNALDLSALRLRNGRRLSIVSGWQGDARERAFWRAARDAACKQFNVVLSPEYNKAHANHFHFDMGPKRGCR